MEWPLKKNNRRASPLMKYLFYRGLSASIKRSLNAKRQTPYLRTSKTRPGRNSAMSITAYRALVHGTLISSRSVGGTSNKSGRTSARTRSARPTRQVSVLSLLVHVTRSDRSTLAFAIGERSYWENFSRFLFVSVCHSAFPSVQYIERS